MEGKTLFPAIFGTNAIQWGCAGIGAIFVSLGLFFSILGFFSNRTTRRETGVACLGFLVLFTMPVTTYCIMTPMMLRLSEANACISTKNDLPRVLHKIYGAEAPKNDRIAKLMFTWYGIAVPYQMEDGSYVSFKPSQPDRKRWQQSQEAEAQIEKNKISISWTLQQLPFLALAYIGSFFIVFLVGVIILMFREKKGSGPDAQPDSPRGL